MPADTKETILAIARAQVQAHGYDGLNFRYLSARAGIRSASLYHHFPNKAALGTALARRYREDTEAALEVLTALHDSSVGCLRAYPEVFRKALEQDKRICLASFMSAEADDVPEQVRAEVRNFIAVNVRWLATHLCAAANMAPSGAGRRAEAIYAGVVGAQLTARGQGGLRRYDEIIAGYREVGLLPT